MARQKFLLNNNPIIVYKANISKEGERAVDVAKLEIPVNVRIGQHDDIKFLNDIVDLNGLVMGHTFNGNLLDHSGNNNDFTGTDVTYVSNDGGIGKSLNLKAGISCSVSDLIPETDIFTIVSKVKFPVFSEIFNSNYTGSNSRVSANYNGGRLGIRIKEDNPYIGKKIKSATWRIRRVGSTHPNDAVVGVFAQDGTLKASVNVDVATLGTTWSAVSREFGEVTVEKGDIIFLQYLSGNSANYVEVSGSGQDRTDDYTEVVGRSPWQVFTTWTPYVSIGAGDQGDQTIFSRRTATNNGIIIQLLKTGKVMVKVQNTTLTSEGNYNDGEQHVILLERDPFGSIKVLIDATEELIEPFTGTISGGITYIGQDYNGSSNSNLELSDLRIYHRLLTNNEQNVFATRKLPVNIMQFGGTVWKVENSTAKIKVQARSYGRELGEVEIFGEIFRDATPEHIIETLVNNNTNLTYVDTGNQSGIDIQEFIANGKLIDILNNMSTLTNKVWRTDPRRNFLFEEQSANSTTLTYTHGKNSRSFATASDDTELVNEILILGENQQHRTHESFVGNNVKTEYVLQNDPLVLRVLINNVEQNPETYDVSVSQRSVTFETAPATGRTILFQYTYEQPLYIRQLRQDSIDQYGARAKKLILPWIRNYSDGIKFASSFLNVFSIVRKNLAVEIPTFDHRISENDVVRVVNSVKGIDGTFLVKAISFDYPKLITTVDVGEFSFSEFESRKRLLQKVHDIESLITNDKKIDDYQTNAESISITEEAIIYSGVQSYSEEVEITTSVDGATAESGTYDRDNYDETVYD